MTQEVEVTVLSLVKCNFHALPIFWMAGISDIFFFFSPGTCVIVLMLDLIVVAGLHLFSLSELFQLCCLQYVYEFQSVSCTVYLH